MSPYQGACNSPAAHAEPVWVFRLTPLQRYCNPPNLLVPLVFLALMMLILIWLFLHMWYVILMLILVGVFIGRSWLRMPYPHGYSTKDELSVAIKDDALGYGIVGKIEWIPHRLVRRVSWGVFGCGSIGLISGHMLTVPKPILKTKEFGQFFGGVGGHR